MSPEERAKAEKLGELYPELEKLLSEHPVHEIVWMLGVVVADQGHGATADVLHATAQRLEKLPAVQG